MTTFSALDALVRRGQLPGWSAAVIREDGSSESAAGGLLEPDGSTPVTPDTLYWIASLSKPVLALITMGLVDDGVLGLDDDVRESVPELAGVTVLRPDAADLSGTEPVDGPITVRHLLTMTSGWGVLLEPDPIARAMAAAGIAPGPAPFEGTTEDYLSALAGIPLAFQPGLGWRYHTCADVLGIMLELLTGQDGERLLGERVREPLGLSALGFRAPAGRPIAPSFAAIPGGGFAPLPRGGISMVASRRWRRP